MKLRLLILLGMLLAVSMIHATDPWGEPVSFPGSMVVMAQVSINGSPAAANDVLGAFVLANGTEQLRGKQAIMEAGDITGALLQIFCETNGETIRFRVWDEDAQVAYDAHETLLTEVNGNVGSFPDNMFQINGVSGQNTDDPWGQVLVLPQSMTVMAEVLINDLDAQTSDVLAAVVMVNYEEQLRGKALVQLLSGIPFCSMQIYTVNSEEEIIFKVWDFSEQQILSALNPLLSEPGTSLGSAPQDAYLINFAGSLQQIPRPTIDPLSGTYSSSQLVNLSCELAGVEIRYTTDGSMPGSTSAIYSGAFTLPTNTTTVIKAKAFSDNSSWYPSLTNSASYQIIGQIAAPQISPAGGFYTDAQMVSITCATAGTDIRYTMDGSEPTDEATLYEGLFTLTQSCTLKAKAFMEGWPASPTTIVSFNISQFVEPPVFTPFPGHYSYPIVLQIFSSTTGSQIYYTLDGSEPERTSLPYTGPILLSESTVVKAIAYYLDWLPSQISIAEYIISTSVSDANNLLSAPGIRSVLPNPFKELTTFHLQGKDSPTDYELKIYNLKGQCVYRTSGSARGEFELQWNGRDASGGRLAVGVYLARFSTGSESSLCRVVLLR
ncbi:MAG: chitobiase/beta-hexosaminidase C-terminal domain-containing protein [Candidatus Cloacimonetes bacterium]|jgi:hypothetical protein|nr:chitobiase/beta-hexosaminidase C-terminal domain-containing protein [Candidatus Cloacimonadota bacterium]MDY0172739.1 chitobiase/beta-hexosaminidase C-terminal domain-containing protein [Candidatus Cloacimonadaceae bacterium]